MALIDHELNAIPDGAETGYVRTPDGTTIRFARWQPPREGRGTVVIVPGRADYIERYFETVRDLQARGFMVVAFDLRGQGGSERPYRDPLKGHVGDFEEYVEDLDTILDQVVFPSCPPPFFALGHSAGATVLLLASADGRSRFRRQVLISPFLGMPPHPIPEGIGRVMASALSTIGLGRLYIPGAAAHVMHKQPFEGNKLTTDPRRYARNVALSKAHPELTVGAPTMGWVRAAFQALDRIDAVDFPPRIHVPTLMVAAGAERIVSLPVTERFASRFKAGHLIVLPGARHELLHEAEAYREQFFAAFDAFIPGA